MSELNDISTWLRGYAYECGGGHHTYKEIQKDLLAKADELIEVGYGFVTLAKQIQGYTGVTDAHYQMMLRTRGKKRGEDKNEKRYL